MKHRNRSVARRLNKKAVGSSYADIPAGMTFTVIGTADHFVKLANSNSVNERTGKDAIFALHDRVFPQGMKKNYVPVKRLA